MIKLLIGLIVLSLVFSGVLYKGVDVIYASIILIGIWFFFTQNKEFSIELKWFYNLALILMLAIVVSVVSFDVHEFFGWRFTSFQVLLFIPFIAAYVMHDQISDKLLWRALILTGLFSPAWVLLILWEWPVQRSVGLLFDPISRGNMAMLFALISMVAMFAVKGNYWKLLAFVGFVGGIMLSVLSGSRGGWLALVISLLTLTFIFFRFSKKNEFKTMVYALSFLLLIVIIFWDYLPVQRRLILAVSDLQNYYSGDIHTSVGYRLELWKVSYYAFLEKPLFGWGWTNFDTAHQFVMQMGLSEKTRLFGHPHNQFLLFLVEVGLFGLLALLAFLLWPFFVAIRYIKNSVEFTSNIYWALLMIVVTESIFEFSLTVNTFSQKYFIFVYLLLSIMFFKSLSKECIGLEQGEKSS